MVDILAVDDYPVDPTDPLQNDWQPLIAQFNGVKPIALAEFGGMPDIERVHLFRVWFAYFEPWIGSYIRSAPPATITRIYNSPEVVSLDEMNARPPMIVSNAPLASGIFQLAGTGPRGAAFRIPASSDLSIPHTSWPAITNGILSGGVFKFNDPAAVNYSQRFYQVVTP